METDSRLAQYCARIGLTQLPTPDAGGLAAVQAAHRRAITFENLDILLGRPIQIGSDAVFAKLVSGGRGGYCFEQNRLLSDMLTAFGLENRLLLARALLGDPAEMPPRTHCLVLAQIGGEPWLADAGFGGSFCPPMPLRDGAEGPSADGAVHRLRRVGAPGSLIGEWLLERRGPAEATDGRVGQFREAGWIAQYGFDLAEVAPGDLAMGNHWTSSHHSARFTSLHVVSLCLPDGFAGLVDRQFSLYRAGQPAIRREIADAADYGAVLTSAMNLPLPPEDVARLPLFAA